MARSALTNAPFTLADRAWQDAALGLYYAGKVAFWRHAAVGAGSGRRYFLSLAREAETKVVACAVRIELRLQLLDDQRASA